MAHISSMVKYSDVLFICVHFKRLSKNFIEKKKVKHKGKIKTLFPKFMIKISCSFIMNTVCIHLATDLLLLLLFALWL